tara:strand:- start:706 stop:1095 length:390 start_codon:yes stop_codon:yes gene_type:complete
MKNQLFRHSPNEKTTLDVLSLFGIQGFDDNHSFTRENLVDLKTVEKMNDMIDSLSLYYIPCKSKQYLTDLTEKKCITVLRQLLKIHNYTLFSKEKFVKGKKHLFYQVIPIQVELLTTNRTQNQIIISFD